MARFCGGEDVFLGLWDIGGRKEITRCLSRVVTARPVAKNSGEMYPEIGILSSRRDTSSCVDKRTRGNIGKAVLSR